MRYANNLLENTLISKNCLFFCQCFWFYMESQRKIVTLRENSIHMDSFAS